MEYFMTFVIYLFLPLGIVQLIYRIIDRKTKVTKKLVEKHPIFKEKKIAIQVFATVGVVLAVGLVGMPFGMSRELFFIITGCIVGLVNGVAFSITYLD